MCNLQIQCGLSLQALNWAPRRCLSTWLACADCTPGRSRLRVVDSRGALTWLAWGDRTLGRSRLRAVHLRWVPMCHSYIKLIQIVGRLHFGAFSPARHAPEVRLLCPCYIKFTQRIAPVLLDVAGVGRLHFGALSPARRALEVRLDVFLLYPTHSDLACLGSLAPVGLAIIIFSLGAY